MKIMERFFVEVPMNAGDLLPAEYPEAAILLFDLTACESGFGSDVLRVLNFFPRRSFIVKIDPSRLADATYGGELVSLLFNRRYFSEKPRSPLIVDGPGTVEEPAPDTTVITDAGFEQPVWWLPRQLIQVTDLASIPAVIEPSCIGFQAESAFHWKWSPEIHDPGSQIEQFIANYFVQPGVADIWRVDQQIRELRFRNSLLQGQLDSVNRYVASFSSGMQAAQVKEVAQFYHHEYEVLPSWFKKLGHIIKVVTGKRTFRSLYRDDVSKYRE